MMLALQDGWEIMVRFKDYFLFVPQHIKGGNAILQGQAFVEALSVEEQRHFAEYAGLSFEKNSAITNFIKTLSFISEKVKIQKEH
jgi:hypothetical protein